MKVAVLGCGPSGLVAAHAAQNIGHRVTIFGAKQKSQLHGSQYLHAAIPGIPCDHADIQYFVDGDIQNYLKRIYGPDAKLENPTDLAKGTVRAWDIRHTYELLWDLYETRIVDCLVDYSTLPMITNTYDKVISTIPADWTCKANHLFTQSYIWAAGETSDGALKLPGYAWVPNNTIVRNGNNWAHEKDWTRASRTFGVLTVEWPDMEGAPVRSAARVPKPLDTDCDCWPAVMRVGRFGKWDRQALVHSIYNEVRHALQGRR